MEASQKRQHLSLASKDMQNFTGKRKGKGVAGGKTEGSAQRCEAKECVAYSGEGGVAKAVRRERVGGKGPNGQAKALGLT